MDEKKVTAGVADKKKVNSTLRGIVNYTDAIGNRHVLEVPVTFSKNINDVNDANTILEPVTSSLKRSNCVINSCSIVDALDFINGGAQIIIRENDDNYDYLGKYKAFSKTRGRLKKSKIVSSPECSSRLEALQALAKIIGDFDLVHDLVNIIVTNDGSLTENDIIKWFY